MENEPAIKIQDTSPIADAPPISDATRLAVTVCLGIVGGILAIPGVLMALFTTGHGSLFLVYIILIGPTVEEILKQSGLLFLLLRKPYLVGRRWQFPLASLLGALTFAVLENLIYQHIYLSSLPHDQLMKTMAFRWVVCTALHLVCSAVSGAGLLYAWERSRKQGELFNFRYSLHGYGLAIAIHCAYNLVVTLIYR